FERPDGSRFLALDRLSLEIADGEFITVVGPSGCGKSTLMRLVTGLWQPSAGRVSVAGRDTAHHPPRELADVVGVVGQDPLAGFVTDTVEEELAYGMEQLAVPPAVMRKRVEETLDLLGIADLRSRALHELSGGQQQRVAIGSVLTAHPRVLVLDEPTSALDPTAAEDVLAAITRLVHDLGVTVVLAEHRLERVVQYADRVLHLPGDGTVAAGAPAPMLRRTSVAPPVVELGRLAGWDPLPLSVRDARRAARALRDTLPPTPRGASSDAPDTTTPPVPLLTARGVGVRHGDVVAVRDVDLDLHGGSVVALMGRNGSGKSSLLWALQGSGVRQFGRVDVGGQDPARVGRADARRLVGLVPQTPADLLYLTTVRDELHQAERESGAEPGAARALLDRLAPGVVDDIHPRDLSEGQRLSLVLAIALCATPSVMLLDEPTRGLDYAAKQSLAAIVADLAAQGRSVVVSTHDVEFVAVAADRVVVLGDGEVVADGPTPEVIVASPAFAPQVAKILAPLPYLTVAQVQAALSGGLSA
ncbi:ABC transporter ATP-binding protein, partial [Jatrophihabitans endophyticus]|uniref:ABC transporter ATP-binding protein n=1 Tax=Jatrophihabitans endophyticus TaxID=1206085 RepID=UPI0019F42828